MPETNQAPVNLTILEALRVIRELAADSASVITLRHAQQRMRQRGITRMDIERCLQRGSITEGPFMNDHGHWQVTMRRHAASEEMQCVVAIDWATRLLIITVY